MTAVRSGLACPGEVLARAKAHLDPKGILNPGVLVPHPRPGAVRKKPLPMTG